MDRRVVVGSGIVGLAVAARMARRGHAVTVLEKEDSLAAHQTGRNSGVVHSGLYYAPGSHKARMSRAGARSMQRFAREQGVPVEVCGKLVVAVDDSELPRLHRLAERAVANEVPARLIDASEARDYEPHARCVAALRVEATGIIDYRQVCEALAEQVRSCGGDVLLDHALLGARTQNSKVRIRTSAGNMTADALVVCGGLQADRLARACGLEPEARIVPFRGEYVELTEQASPLVRGLIYPAPDPRFPFLGVHLTRGVHGTVHGGPNAVLALAREGYRWRDVNLEDVVDSLTWPGLWRLGAHNVGTGAHEVARSVSRRLFARSLARLVPEIREDDLLPSPAGVRAQALRRDGQLVDDFLVQTAPRQVHVLNAPSPAATSALEIARHIDSAVDRALCL